MFNLNIPTTSLLGIDSGSLCTTPKTPEILNSLIAMTNPLDNYTFASGGGGGGGGGGTMVQQQQSNASTPLSSNGNYQMISQDSNHSSCSGSPLDSPAGSNSTPSVQQTRSQLIKAGLKLTIQSKRKMSSSDSSSGTDQPHSKTRKFTESSGEEETDSRSTSKQGIGLTPEDEDRRRRRRERNKIAATKCRMKKRERTNNLVTESEQLENQNNDLKSTVRNLETERRKLVDMLQSHTATCIRPGGYQPDVNACQSPACKYFNEIGFGDSQCEQHQLQDQHQHSQRTNTAIPSMSTIKYSRNTLRHHPNHQQQQQHQHQQPTLNNLSSHDLQLHSQLPNGYCKPSPTTHEIGYLNSPSQDLCLQPHDITSQASTHPAQQHHHLHHQLTTALLKNDYIPNCENSNGGSTVDSTPDFVLKNEYDSQSPYTTVQSADRFLFETNVDAFDMKHDVSNSINNNNNSNTINNNSNVTSNHLDFHHQIATTPTYDNFPIKGDFLANDTEILATLTDGTDSEFTDLDSGITAYGHLTNGGLLV